MRWVAAGLGFFAILAILFVGLKVGGEMHYRNCFQRVELEYPAAFQANNDSSVPDFSGEGSFEFFQRSDREAALQACHGWP